MNKLVLGLDVGISSVGWAVTNKDTGVIVDCGVRLFPEGTAANNQDRRVKRSARRMKRRKANRLKDLVKVLDEFGLPKNFSNENLSPYELRSKGLCSKLEPHELSIALYHLVKKRGSSLETVDDESDESEKDLLKSNDKLIRSGKFVCEIQLDRLNRGESIRGSHNNFRTIDYINEANQLLSHQQMPDEFNRKIIELINRRRHFSEGPGSEKSPTAYGRYFYNEHGVVEFEDLIERMRGKCSVYPDEPRAPKMSPTVELFNFLNDLNNLSFNDSDKLTEEQKRYIIHNYIVGGKQRMTPKEMAKYLGVDLDEIRGFRVDKKEEPLLTEFKGYKALLNVVGEENYAFFSDNFDLLDQISEILTRTKVVSERIEAILELNVCLISSEMAERFAGLKGFSQYHSISFKAINEMIPLLISTTDNQMQILTKMNLDRRNIQRLVGRTNIPVDNEAVLSPVAKKSQQEALKIVNAARKKFGEFSEIIVEMPRDKNSDEQKKQIKDRQKREEVQNKEAIELAGKDINLKTRIKISLYKQQDGKCLYSGDPLDLKLIIEDSTAYEIDHIIPISISLDDSLQNKVLVTHHANQQKGNLTPLMALSSKKINGWGKESYIANVEHLYKSRKITEKKRGYLLFSEDITKFSVMKNFINRNLVDTRYASRVVLNSLQDYFKANQINTKVVTVRGSMTSTLRKHIGIEKNRDEDYLHHAIDAATISLVTAQEHLDFIYNHVKFESDGAKLSEDENYNPVLDYNDFFSQTFMYKLSQLKDLNEKREIKVSHKVDRKPNRQISDETIYSTRINEGKELVVKKYKDIYEPRFTKLAEMIADEKDDRILMYHHDRETYNKLKAIVDNYLEDFKQIGKDNPFYLYKEEHGFITKFSKKDNGPAIISVKYYDGELGNHIDVSHNYEINDGKKVVLLQISPYRTDFYKTKDGYKFVTVRYSNVRYSQLSKKYYILEDWYNNEKVKKGIKPQDEFLFSMHRNEYIEIEKMEKHKDGTYTVGKEMYRYVATNNDNSNVVEVNPISYYEKKQLKITVGSKITNLTKFTSDVLGNISEVTKECLKLEFELGRM